MIVLTFDYFHYLHDSNNKRKMIFILVVYFHFLPFKKKRSYIALGSELYWMTCIFYLSNVLVFLAFSHCARSICLLYIKGKNLYLSHKSFQAIQPHFGIINVLSSKLDTANFPYVFCRSAFVLTFVFCLIFNPKFLKSIQFLHTEPVNNKLVYIAYFYQISKQ